MQSRRHRDAQAPRRPRGMAGATLFQTNWRYIPATSSPGESRPVRCRTHCCGTRPTLIAFSASSPPEGSRGHLRRRRPQDRPGGGYFAMYRRLEDTAPRARARRGLDAPLVGPGDRNPGWPPLHRQNRDSSIFCDRLRRERLDVRYVRRPHDSDESPDRSDLWAEPFDPCTKTYTRLVGLRVRKYRLPVLCDS